MHKQLRDLLARLDDPQELAPGLFTGSYGEGVLQFGVEVRDKAGKMTLRVVPANFLPAPVAAHPLVKTRLGRLGDILESGRLVVNDLCRAVLEVEVRPGEEIEVVLGRMHEDCIRLRAAASGMAAAAPVSGVEAAAARANVREDEAVLGGRGAGVDRGFGFAGADHAGRSAAARAGAAGARPGGSAASASASAAERGVAEDGAAEDRAAEDRAADRWLADQLGGEPAPIDRSALPPLAGAPRARLGGMDLDGDGDGGFTRFGGAAVEGSGRRGGGDAAERGPSRPGGPAGRRPERAIDERALPVITRLGAGPPGGADERRDNGGDGDDTGSWGERTRPKFGEFDRRSARLNVIGGPSAGQIFDLNHGEAFCIGRSPHVEVCLDDRVVSRRNSLLQWRADDELWIEDLGSYNGTRVNGRLQTRAQLHLGDIIEVGWTRLRVEPLGGLEQPLASDDARSGSGTRPRA